MEFLNEVSENLRTFANRIGAVEVTGLMNWHLRNYVKSMIAKVELDEPVRSARFDIRVCIVYFTRRYRIGHLDDRGISGI